MRNHGKQAGAKISPASPPDKHPHSGQTLTRSVKRNFAALKVNDAGLEGPTGQIAKGS